MYLEQLCNKYVYNAFNSNYILLANFITFAEKIAFRKWEKVPQKISQCSEFLILSRECKAGVFSNILI